MRNHGVGGRVIAAAAVLAALAGPALARAHETLHEVRRGEAIAVRAYEDDGEPLAGVAYEVYSPADRKSPWQEGRTDRHGWLAFVPDVAGRWRVRVVEETGHGLDVDIEAGAADPAGSPAAPSALAFVLRPLLGLAAVAAIFAGLVLFRRRKGAGR